MREQVLWRKISRIILLLSSRLEISPERALNLFYETNVCAMLHDFRYGLHLMSDTYIINDVILIICHYLKRGKVVCNATFPLFFLTD